MKGDDNLEETKSYLCACNRGCDCGAVWWAQRAQINARLEAGGHPELRGSFLGEIGYKNRQDPSCGLGEAASGSPRPPILGIDDEHERANGTCNSHSKAYGKQRSWRTLGAQPGVRFHMVERRNADFALRSGLSHDTGGGLAA